MSVCPICFDQAGALADGARAGAAVLAVIAALIIGSMIRFAIRLR